MSSGGSHLRFRVCSLFTSFGNSGLINLRPDGDLRWKVETSVGKVGEW
jgi:hypothetical protein